MSSDLRERDQSVVFYDARFSGHYMEEWTPEAKARISESIGAMNLPQTGHALDFGCGNGVMTEVVRIALGPRWHVCGSDFSAVAVENARRLYPRCEFRQIEELSGSGRQFDFVFTHHVLEHVHDLGPTVREIAAFAKPGSAMIHILPCGNEGSLEHHVASLRMDGIDPAIGNRFFFEDEGHLRRLRSEELASMFEQEGFRLERAYFRNQYYGALDWMTQSGPAVVRNISDNSRARDAHARKELARLRSTLISWWLLRYPATFTETRLKRRRKTAADWLLLPFGLLLYPISKPFDLYLRRRAVHEWNARKNDPNGSEMFLFLRRSAV